MSSPRPLDSGRVDSLGRPIKISADNDNGRADAPPPPGNTDSESTEFTAARVFEALEEAGIGWPVEVLQTGGGVANLVLGPKHMHEGEGYEVSAVSIGPGTYDWSNESESEFSFEEVSVGPEDPYGEGHYYGPTNMREFVEAVAKTLKIHETAHGDANLADWEDEGYSRYDAASFLVEGIELSEAMEWAEHGHHDLSDILNQPSKPWADDD